MQVHVQTQKVFIAAAVPTSSVEVINQSSSPSRKRLSVRSLLVSSQPRNLGKYAQRQSVLPTTPPILKVDTFPHQDQGSKIVAAHVTGSALQAQPRHRSHSRPSNLPPIHFPSPLPRIVSAYAI
jgi:hypothetical protein